MPATAATPERIADCLLWSREHLHDALTMAEKQVQAGGPDAPFWTGVVLILASVRAILETTEHQVEEYPR